MKGKNSKTSILSVNNLSHARLLVQGGFALFCLFAGYRFYHFYLWAIGKTDVFTPRPPSVEGFLPISALVNLKRFILTGVFDNVHPAGLTIFMAAIAIAFVARKGFCGWICPVGFTSNLAEKLAKKIKILRRPPAWLDYPLLTLKYLLLTFFAYLIILSMDISAIEAFNRSPYNMVVDAKMLLFFLEPTILTIWVMVIIIAASFVLRNFWCHYLCPYGALLGIFSLVSPAWVIRDREKCINCKKCDKACPGSIEVSKKIEVRTSECIGCLECVSNCPVEDCLQVTGPADKRINPWLLPGAVLVIFFTFWAVANLTGHWHNEIPLDMLRKYYAMSMKLAHP